MAVARGPSERSCRASSNEAERRRERGRERSSAESLKEAQTAAASSRPEEGSKKSSTAGRGGRVAGNTGTTDWEEHQGDCLGVSVVHR